MDLSFVKLCLNYMTSDCDEVFATSPRDGRGRMAAQLLCASLALRHSITALAGDHHPGTGHREQWIMATGWIQAQAEKITS